MLAESQFDTGVVCLNYAVSSEVASPIVLLHGLPGHWQEFLPIIPALTQRWQVFAVDLRGQGKSTQAERYLPQDYIADTIAFLEHLAEPAVLFGMSAGGLIALGAAAQCPDRTRAVIIGDSPVDLGALAEWMSSPGFAAHFSAIRELAGSDKTVDEIALAIGDLPALHPETGDLVTQKDLPGKDVLVLRAWAQVVYEMAPGVLDYHATGRGSEYLAAVDMAVALASITCPTLLLRADPDRGAMLTAQSTEWAKTILPGAMDAQLDGLDHNLGLDTWNPARLLTAVMSFLELLR